MPGDDAADPPAKIPTLSFKPHVTNISNFTKF